MISFLKEVFLPTRFRDYFLFSSSFLAIEYDLNKIRSAKLNAVGNKRSIVTVDAKLIEFVTAENRLEAISVSIKELFREIGSYQDLVVVLPNHGIIFKELSVPFSDYEKITEILPFEVEPLIPFAKELARIEFIQTKIYPDGRSDILVAIVQQSFVDQYIAPFQSAGFETQRVSVRAFLFWYIFMHSPILSSQDHLVIDFNTDHCTLLFFVERQLRLIRVIPYGIVGIVNQIAQITKQSPEEISHVLTQNIELMPETARASYGTAIKKFKTDLLFTIQSLTLQKTGALALTCFHKELDLRGLGHLLASELRAEVRQLIPTVIMEQLQIDNGQKVNHQFLPCVIAALPALDMMRVNFVRGLETKKLRNLYVRQVVTTIIVGLTIVLFTIFSYRNTIQVLKHETQVSEAEIIRTLRDEFEIPAEEKTVEDVIDYASREAVKKQKTWLAFSNQARTSLLQYLLELTERINKESLGFALERITFEQNRIILKAEVRDYEALKTLERELRQSKLFTYVEPQDNPRFTMTINLLPIGEQ